jgi:hypothetical protein
MVPLSLVVGALYYILFALDLNETPPSHLETTPVVRKVSSHGDGMVILVLALSSAKALNATLNSLFSVRGLHPHSRGGSPKVVISPDSLADTDVEQIIRAWSLPYVPFPKLASAYSDQCSGRKLRGKRSNNQNEHYCLALCHAFSQGVAGSVVVVEDDLIFAPDFLEFFISLAPALQVDPSLSFVSAWNENGFADIVSDPLSLRRTDFFSGVAFLISRPQWDLMRPVWPNLDRDWIEWARDPQPKAAEQKQAHPLSHPLESIHPEVNRVIRQPLPSSDDSHPEAKLELQRRLKRLPKTARHNFRLYYSRMRLYHESPQELTRMNFRWPAPPVASAAVFAVHAAASADEDEWAAAAMQNGDTPWWTLVGSVGVGAGVSAAATAAAEAAEASDAADAAAAGGTPEEEDKDEPLAGGLVYAEELGLKIGASEAIGAKELWVLFLPPKEDGDGAGEFGGADAAGVGARGVEGGLGGEDGAMPTRVLWYDCAAKHEAKGKQTKGAVEGEEDTADWASSFAALFNIWEEQGRGAFAGVHEIVFTPPRKWGAAAAAAAAGGAGAAAGAVKGGGTDGGEGGNGRTMRLFLADVNTVCDQKVGSEANEKNQGGLVKFNVPCPLQAVVVTAKQAEYVSEEQVVYETTHESRGEREGTGERTEWKSTAHLHRKYDIHTHTKPKAGHPERKGA